MYQTDTCVDGFWPRTRQINRQRDYDTKGESLREESVSNVAWFPLFVGMCGLFAVSNQCWNLLHSSPVPIHNTHIHIHSYTHPISPDNAPSLPFLASNKTFPGKNKTVMMTPLSQAFRLFLLFHVSVSQLSFSQCNLCAFFSCTALCCLFIDCECLWKNCTHWLKHWWFHFGT